jgi:carboxymethylenebutenolidase
MKIGEAGIVATVKGMGERISFKSNGGMCDGYLANGGGPGVIVIQEWWGLVPHIEDVADRFAAAGFTALAPDLYHGESSTEPDGAGKLMMGLNLAQAAKDLSGAVDYLQTTTGHQKVGVVGYCMGGGLTLVWRVSDLMQSLLPLRTTASFLGHLLNPIGQNSKRR